MSKVVNYVVKENGEITIKGFDYIDGITVGLTADMFLNIDEIIYDIVNNRITEDDKIYFRDMKDDDLIMEHMGFGMWIRNTYGLWEGSLNPLTEREAEPDSITHPDNLSYKIMEMVKQTLNGGYTPTVAFTSNQFDDAMKIVGDE